MIRLYLEIPVEFVRLIVQDRFLVVPIPFVRMIQFKFLAQFPVDHLPHRVVSSLILIAVLRELIIFPNTIYFMATEMNYETFL